MDNLEILERQAVDAAVQFDWESAVNINKKIISQSHNNLPSHLRLGFAYLQMRKFNESRKYYHKALKLQPNNNVARENLDRIKVLQMKSAKKNKHAAISLDPNLFLEASGKTKSVTLVNLGQKNILAQLTVGEETVLKVKKRKVEVRTKENEYVGSLPDDLSRRLLVFLKAKSKYLVYIKEANLTKVNVFIREDKKGNKVRNYLSFPQNIQAHIHEMQSEKEGPEDSEEINDNDLDRLAENLASEEKDYLPYRNENEEEESED